MSDIEDDAESDLEFDMEPIYPDYLRQTPERYVDEGRRAWILEFLLKIPDGILSSDWRKEVGDIEAYLKTGALAGNGSKLRSVK
jgi:hypothetical protein